eukprot:GFUD01045483.1.p1 GENE.GFUD01045483.1~~GFUD01045483.1.p1  ORF type:complete len:563 (-),score=82.87 GFUD01045483.1:53-1741(-)
MAEQAAEEQSFLSSHPLTNTNNRNSLYGSTSPLYRRSSWSSSPPVNARNTSEQHGKLLSAEPNNAPCTTSIMTGHQMFMFVMILLACLSSSLTVCLFPPFYPKIAEQKGSSATEYGVIIGINCLVAFLVTPFIGTHLSLLGVKFAFSMGLFGGGVCCALSGFLEFFPPGLQFLVFSVLLRIVQATSNAMVVTASFTYTAAFFPKSVGKIFSATRCVINVAKLGGPMFGGLLYEFGGFVCPFVTFGVMQAILAFFSALTLPQLDFSEDEDLKKNKGKVSVLKIFSIPTVWFSFLAFIVSTLCSGMLSVNLEPQVLRHFNFSPFYVGLFYGLRSGANSLASPVWGWISDRNRTSVKPFLLVSALLVSSSFFLMGAGTAVGIHLELTIPILAISLCLHGAGISGQQVAGIMDALHEVGNAGYVDSPSTQGLVAGLWSSLSGLGRFSSRAGSGILVDYFGFNAVVAIACGLQGLLALVTLLYLVMCECSLVRRNRRLELGSSNEVEQGEEVDKALFCPSDASLPISVLLAGHSWSGSGAFLASSFKERKSSFSYRDLKRGRHWSVL